MLPMAALGAFYLTSNINRNVIHSICEEDTCYVADDHDDCGKETLKRESTVVSYHYSSKYNTSMLTVLLKLNVYDDRFNAKDFHR